MAKITTADCKRFLKGYASPFLEISEEVTGLTHSDTWVRLRKYKDASGTICRDFLNKGVPVVVVLAEADGKFVVRRERGLGSWEKAFEANFGKWVEQELQEFDLNWGRPEEKRVRAVAGYSVWSDKVLWPSLRGEDFQFEVSKDPRHGTIYFFKPMSAHPEDEWDLNTPLGHLFPDSLEGCEMTEGFYLFRTAAGPGYGPGQRDVTSGDAFVGEDVTDRLCALGFNRAASLNVAKD